MPEIRAARPGDLGPILALLHEVSLPAEGVEAHLSRFLVAESEGNILGAAGVEMHGDVGLLRSVVVSPSRRGEGIGERLCREAAARAAVAGLGELYLLTESAAGFFGRLDFLPVARESAPAAIRSTSEFASLCPASAVLMRRALKPGRAGIPRLAGRRVALRPITEEDVPALFEIFSNPEVMRYWSRTPLTDLAEAQQLVRDIDAHVERGELLQWGIVESGRDHVVGTVSLFHIVQNHRRAELGYALARAHWGRGYMTEAINLVLDVAFGDMGLHRIEADVDPRNAASIRTLERFGFAREGLLRERWHVAGEICDALFFGLLRPKWERWAVSGGEEA